jgi:hypothetical protein
MAASKARTGALAAMSTATPRLPSLRASAAAVAALAFALTSLAVLAQGQDAWYTIELIVFEQIESTGLPSERWPLDPGRPPVDEAIQLAVAGELAVTMDEARPQASVQERRAFELLPEDELSLRETWARLRRSRDYRPVLHLGWRQPGFTREEARAVHVRSAPAEPAVRRTTPRRFERADGGLATWIEPRKLEGTLRLYRSRYLHIEADLLYYRPDAAPLPLSGPDASGNGIADQSLTAADVAGPEAGLARPPVLFRMTTQRRMRSRELHYLDHPLFGVIVLATPYEPPAPPAPAAAAPAQPGTADETPTAPPPTGPASTAPASTGPSSTGPASTGPASTGPAPS